MGRRPPIDLTGLHHAINRGVERSNVYKIKQQRIAKYLKLF